jgi:hypothetical protein
VDFFFMNEWSYFRSAAKPQWHEDAREDSTRVNSYVCWPSAVAPGVLRRRVITDFCVSASASQRSQLAAEHV